MSASFWQRVAARAPRQLRPTFAGKVLIGMALAAGLAAINSGNNLLFFVWGMALTAIALSGVLSEASLRRLRVVTGAPPLLRAGTPAALDLRLEHAGRVGPAYATVVQARITNGTDAQRGACAPCLLLRPGAVAPLRVPLPALRRGGYRLHALAVATRYPFGLFVKGRPLPVPAGVVLWCAPAAVAVPGLVAAAHARLGFVPEGRPGAGEDFFALRPYRVGDSPRRVAWRRALRTGRWAVRESEATRGESLSLEWRPDPAAQDAHEAVLEVLASLAEALLARGLQVGVRAPGIAMAPAAGAAQARAILHALARCDPRAALPRNVSGGGPRLVLHGPGALGSASADALPLPFTVATTPRGPWGVAAQPPGPLGVTP